MWGCIWERGTEESGSIETENIVLADRRKACGTVVIHVPFLMSALSEDVTKCTGSMESEKSFHIYSLQQEVSLGRLMGLKLSVQHISAKSYIGHHEIDRVHSQEQQEGYPEISD